MAGRVAKRKYRDWEEGTGWRVVLTGLGVVHVMPVGDTWKHVQRGTCWCEPTVTAATAASRRMVVHRAADGRELVEAHGVQ